MRIRSGRRLLSLFVPLLWLPALSLAARAQSGVSIVPDNLYQSSGSAGANATAEPIGISGQSFTLGYRIAVNGTSANHHDAGLGWRTTQPVNQGDNLQVTFWVRKIAPLDGHNIRGFVAFEQVARPNAKSLFTPFPCDSDVWTKYAIPFKAAANHLAGEAQLTFQFAHGPQTFEIGGIGLVNLGPTPPAPSTAASVLPDDVYRSHYFYLDSAVGGAIRPITIEGQPFTQGYEIAHNGDSEFIYRSGLGWKNARAIAKGDLLQLTFWARKLEPADANIIRAQVVFERSGGNFEKSLNTNFPNDSGEWRQFRLPCRASAAFAPNEAQLVFQFALGPQKFQIGGISLVNYGQGVKPNQLPTAFYYPTRGDANAVWRTAVRGFKGAYNVTVVLGRISQTVPATIDEKNEITITLDTTLPRQPIKRGDGRKLQGN